TGFPTATDNCTPSNELTVNYFDDVVSLPCGTMQNGQQVTKRIDRTWTVADAYGNTNGCLQKIWLKHITFANVTFPPSLDGILNPSLNCDQDPNDLSVTGRPTVEGVPIDNSPDCEFGVIFSDQTINICPPAGYSVIRTWTAIDFCTSQVTNRVQVIKVEDKTPPLLTTPLDITVGTDGFLCTGTVDLPAAETTDDCSAVTVTPTWLYGTGFGPFIGIPEGIHLVTYTATDACGNTATATMRVTVADAAPPSAICATFLQVSLTATGVGYVNAGTVNGGSFDNCGPVTLAISRDDTLFTPTVQVTCADIGPPLLLTLKVTDAVGLENFCVSEVNVRDFLKPNLSCPANVSLTCLQDHTDLQLTGFATASDNCALQSLDFVDISNIGPCNVGSVTRMWKATDADGNTRTCAQQITLNVLSDVSIVFPPDVTVSVCADPSATLPPATGEPLTAGQHCSPLSVTYTDQIFTGVFPPACYRIFRAWKVIDFCIYDPNDDSTGVWEHTQIIDVTDDAPPVLALPPDLTVNADFPDCTAQVVLADATATDCSDQISIFNDGPYPGANASGSYPMGVHHVVFTATDACGNTAQQTLTISVQDLTPPKALCKNGLTIPLDSTGVATIDAAVLDNGSSDHCTLPGSLSFAVVPDSFSCQTIGDQQVTLTVTDAAGNVAACSTVVTVTDPLGACLPPPPPAFTIEGTIRTEKGVAVAEIPLTLKGDGFFANAECDAGGHYIFEDVPVNNYYTLTPANNAKWLNGLTTFDLVLISKHILGLDTFDSPFKYIAADANRSGTVTTFDIVQFRKVILGISDTVPGNTSWRFVDAAYTFPDPADPFSAVFPEKKVYNTLGTDQTAQDFTGVKIGDLNNSTDAADPRAPSDTLYISVPNTTLPAGETVAVPFYLNNWQQLEGFQFELQFDPDMVALQDIQFARPDLFGAGHWVYKPDGRLAFSWDHAAALYSTPADSLLFTLYLRATVQKKLASVVQPNAERIVPEAYRAGDALPAVIAMRLHQVQQQQQPETFTLMPARPNPFSRETSLPFYLPEATGLTLRIADVSGSIVFEKTSEFPAGYGEWQVAKETLAGPGVYGFRMSSPSQGRGGVLILLGEE
ncbi:MAG TPA: HYR domain-containing protein, partial [Saprospiraceae bacterium]|nr:HYR domain-containing protein [Saprospiraceae bacterium]